MYFVGPHWTGLGTGVPLNPPKSYLPPIRIKNKRVKRKTKKRGEA